MQNFFLATIFLQLRPLLVRLQSVIAASEPQSNQNASQIAGQARNDELGLISNTSTFTSQPNSSYTLMSRSLEERMLQGLAALLADL